MSDPRRLLEDDSTELERLLLHAVAKEQPGRQLQRRMRVGLGLASSLFTLKAAAAALSVVSVAVGAAVVVVHQRAEPAAIAPARVQRSVPPSPAPPAAATEGQAPAPAPSPVPAPSPALNAPVSALPSAPSPARSSGRVSTADDVREQTRLLDRARSALRDGSPKRALVELNRYTALYPKGVFAQEASVLRIEALRRSGQDAKASALARDFIRRHADSPHVESLAQSLDAAGSEP